MAYTDLHAHLEGTVSAATIIALILKYEKDRSIPDDFSEYQREIITEIYKKIDEKASDAKLESYLVSKLQLSAPAENLMEFIIRLPTKFLKAFIRTKEDINFVLNETLEQYDASFKRIEFIFCPVALQNESLSDDDIVDAISEFWKNHPKKDSFSFILSLRKMMEDVTMEYVNKVVEKYSDYFDKGIPKLDVCGNEAAISYSDLSEQLDILSKSKQELTLHIGEVSDKDMKYIMQNYPAIKQFNHGIQGAFNEEVLEMMKKNDIFLTICPLSNLYTGVLGEEKLLETITTIKDAGIRYSICSDDATIINGDVKASHSYLEEKAPDLIS